MGQITFIEWGAISQCGPVESFLLLPPTREPLVPSFCLLTEPVSSVLFWDVVAGPCRARLYSWPHAASVLPPTPHLPRQWILSESQGSYFTDLVIEQIFVENSPGTGTEQPLCSWGLWSSGQRGYALCAFVFYSIPRGVL